MKRRFDLVSVLSLIVTMLFLFRYGSGYLPGGTNQDCRVGQALKVMTHNTGQNLLNVDLLMEQVETYLPNLIVLQEVAPNSFDALVGGLEDRYPFHVQGPPHGENMITMVVFSEHQIIEHRNYQLNNEGLVQQQEIKIQFHNREIVLINVHTTFPWIWIDKDPWISLIPWPRYDDGVRRKEIKLLTEIVNEISEPLLLAGDFNLSDESSDYRKILETGMNDSYGEMRKGMGYTWPANRTPSVNIQPAIPIVRPDYIFHSNHFCSVSADVLKDTGSDHKPVLVHLILK